MKTHSEKSKDGGVLVMAMIVMLAFSILAIGLFKLHETDAVETVYIKHHKQAFWLAEKGLLNGELILQYDKDFRDIPYAIPSGTNAVVGGHYDVTVLKTTVDDVAGIYDFEITSVGYVKGFNRRLRKTYRAFPGGKYAIIGISGHTELAANVTIDGPIAQIEGTVNVHDSRGLNDYIIMGDGEGSLTDKKGVAVVANLPPPPAPSIDASKYLDLLVSATNYPATNNVSVTVSSLSGLNVYNNATNTTVYFDSKIKIADNSVIIANGNIRFQKSGVSIGKNVVIVSGDKISFKVQANVAGGVEIFAVNDIEFEAGSGLVSTEPVLLMALNGDITMNANFTFRGIMIAEKGRVELNANGDISGTVIGGVGVAADANITITYDESVFTEGTPVIPKSFGDVILTAATWQELPPL
ncbi:MAG: hypothetical protein DRR04_09620 [Gammaproteobacteria bacterium]|nr:MAG: hypothetical protein DRR04_09620 [Gammaproteobacteria bacterium]